MVGLPTELQNRCRDTFLKCSEFDSAASLRAVFVTTELRPFRDRLPTATSKSERVDVCLAFLLDNRFSDGRPLLPTFLSALRDRYQPGNALRDELEALGEAVQGAVTSSDLPLPEKSSESVPPAPPRPPSSSGLWDLLSRYSVVWVAMGVVFVVAITILFFQLLRCVLEFRITEATVALIALLAVGAGMAFKITPQRVRKVLQGFYGGFAVTFIIVVVVMKFLPPPLPEDCFATPVPTPTDTPTPTRTTTPTISPTLTPSLTPSPSPTPTSTLPSTITPTPTCLFQAETVTDTITSLIHAESEAVCKKDISTIQAIFAQDAVIEDAVTGDQWNDPITRYTTLFAEISSITVEHFDIQPAGLGVAEDVAWFTSGNTTTLGTPPITYTNKPGSDHWTFGRNDQGCWVITDFTFNASHIPFPPPTPVAPTSACFCQSATDEATLRCLIQAESEAVNNEDLTLIQQIFAPNATILRGDNGQHWNAPMDYYSPTFASLDFADVGHFDVQQIEITGQVAWFTSGSRGYYGAPGATPDYYDNQNPSDHWTFSKNELGCWIITEFAFNASHIPFP